VIKNEQSDIYFSKGMTKGTEYMRPAFNPCEGTILDIEKLIRFMEITPGSAVIDLGAGDGSLIVKIHDFVPNTSCRGFELSDIPDVTADVEGVDMVRQDLFDADISTCDIVICNTKLCAKDQVRLFKKCKEMKPGARIVSYHEFPINPHWQKNKPGMILNTSWGPNITFHVCKRVPLS